jgi:hypothetical protein
VRGACARWLLFTLLIAKSFSAASARTPTDKGEAAGYWDNHSVVIAEVKSARRRRGSDFYDLLRLRPIGCLSGSLDPAQTPEMNTWVVLGSQISVIQDDPTPGDFVLAVVRSRSADEQEQPGFYIPYWYANYMPAEHACLLIVHPTAPRVVDDALMAIRKARKMPEPKTHSTAKRATGFWRSHCLICADVEAVAYRERTGFAPQLTLLPKMTLSRAFYACEPAKITADAPIADGQSLPAAGNKVVTLLTLEGDRYSVYEGKAEFMPGEHSSICVVKDFFSPFVLDTAKAVQKSRKNDKPEKNDAKAEKGK